MKYEALFNRVLVPKIGEISSFDSSFGFIGSCFSSSIHERFRRVGLSAWMSPYGTTYNPLSIERQLIGTFDLDYKFNEYTHDDAYFYWETSHQLVFSSPEEGRNQMNALRIQAHQNLRSMDYLFITLGSAWVYELEETGLLVANCHKVPQQKFRKRLLEIDEIMDSLSRIKAMLNPFNPFLRILFTVSPVRHLRDGLVENNWSKARLIEACQRICATPLPPTYFPSYELIIDELRDYRFFEPDGVHPNALAIDFVWDKLCESLFDASLGSVFREVLAVRRLESHRFLSAHHEKQQGRAEQVEAMKQKLSAQHTIHW